LSIVTPSYNQGEYLEETIRSVLLQGYPNLEYIVIDGGSEDESVDIIERYEPWIDYWVSEPDDGQAHAINKGLARASGDICAWINSDDIYLEGALWEAARYLNENTDIGAVYAWRVLIDENTNTTGWSTYPAFDPTKGSSRFAQETVFWRHAVQDEIGLLDPELQGALDFEFFARMHKHTKMKLVPYFWGGFRCHDKSKSSNMSKVMHEESRIIWNEHFPESEEMFEEDREWGRAKHIMAALKNLSRVGIPYLMYKAGIT
jgi:glycosyltransferase involved in cell wall biosynthesis